MPLYDYHCKGCQASFESLAARAEDAPPECPKCKSPNTERKLSRFAIGGKADTRESAYLSCATGPSEAGKGGGESGSGGGGHSCGSGCGH